MDPRTRGAVKKLEQILTEFQRHERVERSKRDVTEQVGISTPKGKGDQAEG